MSTIVILLVLCAVVYAIVKMKGSNTARQGNRVVISQSNTSHVNDEVVSRSVSELLSIYKKYPDGIRVNYGNAPTPDQKRIKEIGEKLNLEGGKPFMQSAHARFATIWSNGKMYNPSSPESIHAAENLEMQWNGIGNWQG